MTGNKSGDDKSEKDIMEILRILEKIENNIYFLMKGIAIMFLLIMIALLYIIQLLN